MSRRAGVWWVLGAAAVGLVVVAVGAVAMNASAPPIAGVLVLCVALFAGLLWSVDRVPAAAAAVGDGSAAVRSAPSPARDERRSDALQVIAGAVLGALVIAVGLRVAGAAASTVALLVPLVVLGSGLMWSYDGTRTAAVPAHGADGIALVDVAAPTTPPVVLGDPHAADLPTVSLQPLPEPEGEVVSEAVRADAARSFDLTRFLVDDRPDRIQCANCGRYSGLVRGDHSRITCSACGHTQALSRVQPDTVVRMFNTTVAADPATGDASDVAAPTSHRGG